MASRTLGQFRVRNLITAGVFTLGFISCIYSGEALAETWGVQEIQHTLDAGAPIFTPEDAQPPSEPSQHVLVATSGDHLLALAIEPTARTSTMAPITYYELTEPQDTSHTPSVSLVSRGNLPAQATWWFILSFLVTAAATCLFIRFRLADQRPREVQ